MRGSSWRRSVVSNFVIPKVRFVFRVPHGLCTCVRLLVMFATLLRKLTVGKLLSNHEWVISLLIVANCCLVNSIRVISCDRTISSRLVIGV